MKVRSQSEVAQWCPTLSDLMDYSLPGSSVHGIFQARVLEWGAIAFSTEAAQSLSISRQKKVRRASVYFIGSDNEIKLEIKEGFYS